MIVRYVAYRDGKRVAEGDKTVEESSALRTQADFVALVLEDPDETEMSTVASEFHLPELAVEDAHHKHQRPKVEAYGGVLFVVLRNAVHDRKPSRVELGEIHVFLADDYVIVARHGGESEDVDEIHARIDRRPALLAHGPAAILYAVTDQVVDDYAPVVEAIANDIDNVETATFAAADSRAARRTTERIYELRREVIEVRRATAPLLVPVEQLGTGLVSAIPGAMREYFRDIFDHLQRIDDHVEGSRDLLVGILETNIALVSLRQNDIVRKISGWAAIIAVPTLITGIYGMNFRHMPELDSRFGYPAALLLMLLASFSVYRLLKHVDWL